MSENTHPLAILTATRRAILASLLTPNYPIARDRVGVAEKIRLTWIVPGLLQRAEFVRRYFRIW